MIWLFSFSLAVSLSSGSSLTCPSVSGKWFGWSNNNKIICILPGVPLHISDQSIVQHQEIGYGDLERYFSREKKCNSLKSKSVDIQFILWSRSLYLIWVLGFPLFDTVLDRMLGLTVVCWKYLSLFRSFGDFQKSVED